MKYLLLILITFCTASFAHSQQVRLITISNLDKRISKGKDTTYIINFWATWCVPCIKELDSFEKLNKAYKNEKIKVLLVSVDFKSKLNNTLADFVKKRNLKSEVLLLDENNEQEYINRIDTSWSGAIPATLFIKNNQRKFLEKEFTYTELVKEYQSIKSRE